MVSIWMNSIPELDLDDIPIGYARKFNIVLSESLLLTFSGLSGDQNPLHVDKEYAEKTVFKRRVIPGMLMASFFSKLVGMYIPGKRALYVGQTLKFINPSYIDDEITVEGKVISKSKATRLITMQTTITNSKGQCLVEGEAKVLVRK